MLDIGDGFGVNACWRLVPMFDVGVHCFVLVLCFCAWCWYLVFIIDVGAYRLVLVILGGI